MYNYEIELTLGKILGRDSSCIGKRRYKTISEARKAENRHNMSTYMDHKVRFYNCGFCGDYHVGRAWHKEDVRLLFKSSLSKDEQECLLPLLDEL